MWLPDGSWAARASAGLGTGFQLVSSPGNEHTLTLMNRLWKPLHVARALISSLMSFKTKPHLLPQEMS